MPQPDLAERIRALIAEWTATILLLLFALTLLLQSFVVPTGSMEDTVLIGDHVIVDKLAYAPAGPISKYLLPYTPVRRGDIIVFKYPLNVAESYVKRVIGVPGDRIKIVDQVLYLNGRAVPEPYVVHKTPVMLDYRDRFPAEPTSPLPPEARAMLAEVENGELVVPADHYFALGDNRDLSLDSRYWGFVPRANIIGKPVFVYWSYDAPTERLADRNIISLDHLADLAANFFTKTRWKRTFLLIRGYPLN